MNVAKTQRYLNAKYDNLFKTTRKTLAYRRLWIFYNELSMGYIEVPHESTSYIEVLKSSVREGHFYYDLNDGAAQIIEDNDFWNASGQEWMEDDREGSAYFGRIVLLIKAQFGLSDKEIADITHVQNPCTCIQNLFLKAVRIGWIHVTRFVKLKKVGTCRPGLIKIATETVGIDPQCAAQLENGPLVYKIVRSELLLAELSELEKKALEQFYMIEYMGEPSDPSIDVESMSELYFYAIVRISDRIKEILRFNEIWQEPKKPEPIELGWHNIHFIK